ncbi:MAG: aspartate carbamoyltransferase catalytic subunit [Clostridiales bacterium]|nr:aspartate carbamoyltransferase catalytic subunit [Clostridiales bacterium]
MFFKRKDFISLKEISAEEILYILNTAETMKIVLSQANKKAPHLRGKSVILMFYEKSTRARMSYELAAQYLSANIVDLTLAYALGEAGNLIDMGNLIDQMGADFIVIRHPMSGSARLLAEYARAGVINAGDGLNENPSQSMLDLMTIKTQKGGFEGLKVTIVGDIAHSRVTHSNIWALMKLGTEVTLTGPTTLIPDEWAEFGPRITYNAADAVRGADVIMVVKAREMENLGQYLPSMNEYRNLFKIDERLMKLAKPDAIVMHPGPISRGIELSSQVIDSPQCLSNDQIANGVAVRMALLYLLSLSDANPRERREAARV